VILELQEFLYFVCQIFAIFVDKLGKKFESADYKIVKISVCFDNEKKWYPVSNYTTILGFII